MSFSYSQSAGEVLVSAPNIPWLPIRTTLFTLSATHEWFIFQGLRKANSGGVGGGWYEKKKLLRRKINEWWEEIKIYGEIETAAKTFLVWNIDNDTKS